MDYLSYLLWRYWPVEREFFRHDNVHIRQFNEKTIAVTVAIITTTISTLLLISLIVSLYFSTNNAVKLAIITTFIAAFTVSVGLLTNAQRAEIFSTTAT